MWNRQRMEELLCIDGEDDKDDETNVDGTLTAVSILSTTLTPTVQPTFPLRFVSYASVYSNPTAAVPSPDVVMDQISSVVGRHSPG